MTGHVTYACNCLNVKIHLANKYYLEGHEKFRNDKFTRLVEPPISGWKFELSIEGVTVEYDSLIRLRLIMDNPQGWMTVSCHNCITGDVYSVNRPNTKITYPFENSILGKFGDQVIIHKGTVFGNGIEQLRKKTSYSNTFHIILNPDLPIDHVPQEDEDTCGTELKTQHEQVQQLLRQSLIDMEEMTKDRIEEFRKEQESLLKREKEKATYDCAILWQRMKEIAKTVQEEEQRVRRLAYHKTKNGVTDQILFNRIISDEEQDQTICDTDFDATEIEMQKAESHVQFSQDYLFEPETEQRRRHSAFNRDLLGGFAVLSYINRRSSHVLDESAIASSFKKTHQRDLATEMHPFQRRRSPPVRPSRNRHSLHPLAQPKAAADTPMCSNTPSSWEDNDSEEELFPLDEDIPALNDCQDTPDRRRSTTSRSKRRLSSKYIDFEKEKEEKSTKKDAYHQQQDHTLATSVPITINRPPMSPVQNHSTHFNSAVNDRKPSFVGFDYAEADRRASLQFPPLDNPRKSSIEITLNHAFPSHHTTANDNTQNLNSNKNKIELELEQDDYDQDDTGPMIPPHILAANIATDEAEAVFGSVPRNSIRHRPPE
ncbi:hypothetical protein [Parasitella parasitica]|uniref:Uncharacterized protein n=1 Tax=Parasitella parasitica TaxID=35722 RepID=A0A0B7MXH6_9FUNG|nr:hypothetical protein [Parasitella parasitica]